MVMWFTDHTTSTKYIMYVHKHVYTKVLGILKLDRTFWVNYTVTNIAFYNVLPFLLQPSDGTCPCKPGYQEFDGRSDDCVRRIYPSCAEGSYRSQDGTCRTPRQWDRYCSGSVCRNRGDYVGFDRSLGMCICKVRGIGVLLSFSQRVCVCGGGPS